MPSSTSSTDATTKPGAAPQLPQDPVRSIVSLLLFIHVFCVFMMLTSNLGQSGLQARLSQVLGPYTELMQLDISYIPYHLTHGSILDADNKIRVTLNDGEHAGEIVTLPDAGLRGGLRRQRYQHLARLMSSLVESPNGDNSLALLSEGIGGNVLRAEGSESGELTVVRHLLLSMDSVQSGTREQRDPQDAQYLSDAYNAAIRLFDGEVVVTKKSGTGEVAPVDGSSTSEPATSNPATKTSASGQTKPNPSATPARTQPKSNPQARPQTNDSQSVRPNPNSPSTPATILP